jgi:bifunctional non-homologous end joining protein LigD
MDLQHYRAKRKFQETPEPRGTVKPGSGPLRFVAQEHLASRMHFDFRVELDGTLKSWAVPKGPSIEVEEKRLAVMVEDHPLDYLHFEGIIPKGNYGAGTVMVWDVGTYHVFGITNRGKSEQAIREGMRKGRLHLVLHGRKLKGEYGLIRMKKDDEKSWLLFKKGSAGLRRSSGEDRSVLSGRTMDEIARGTKPGQPGLEFDLSDSPKASMPRKVKPMLATPVATAFDHAGWLFELKWDGYRAIAEIDKGRVRLYSRNQRSFEKRFAPIVESLEHFGHDAVLDGEVVAMDGNGKPSFHLLQEYPKARTESLVYEVFDLLHLDGHDLRNRPLTRRQELLAPLVAELPYIRCSKPIPEHGRAFFDAVSANRLEGIVAKEAGSKYREGVRSKSWLKIKSSQRQKAVIGGFTEPKGSRTGLGAVVLGVYENGDLVPIGDAGSGFTEKELGKLRARLDELVQKTCPFKRRPKPKGKVHWVRPLLVCEVSFAEWTDDGHMRHPVFVGLREDQDASTVKPETPQRVDLVVNDSAAGTKNAGRPAVKETDAKPRPNRQETISGQVVSLTNQHKVYWPNDGFTKGALIDYYREVAGFILPYLNNRPLSLNRHPNGIQGASFFQRDVSNQPPPPWVETAEFIADGKRVRSVLCQDEATLVYLANLGCIELNPWNSRVGTLDSPDYAVLDLDPEDVSFDSVIETAQAIRKVLDRIGVESRCKTSGKRGLHIYIPFGARHGHDQAKHFAELIANVVNARLPAVTSLVRSPRSRQGRVYLDYLQNGKGKTLAGAYSVRPYPGATVSTPLKWTEVRRGLDPAAFTMKTMPKRLGTVGDLWKPVLGPGIDLPASLERLASLLKKAVV